MPGPQKPKTWKAARAFRYRGYYKAGDPVTNRRTIDYLSRFGDRFIVADRTKSAPAEPPADPLDTATSESTKED